LEAQTQNYIHIVNNQIIKYKKTYILFLIVDMHSLASDRTSCNIISLGH